ncbi:hypothetical protein M430DRAFT_141894 [Amorphotheca resinae ATCC 22711]|uniref:Gas1-like protein n=1 Tax=Amorphotheca resinae ATCC 22711 TaxID=857342 RepID=A0A2T3B135_AMORE|nr:hypothetical protein M430DRAFT_141894 [Amorphotheca resinae ATCC 22711]PSS17109.1 hypothetical protein M430DRAFT_141894 [Amorphotheca resinae ATCC 22711]
MYSTFLLAGLVALAKAHGVILAAQGLPGSPASVGFQVDAALARNCTGISPCQQDTTIIRDSEIAANIVNECGRTELTGNIDVGENTENALAAGAVTQVKAGTKMTVTIHQVNADGAGPYTCDLDQTSNAGIISQNLTVTNNIPGVNGLSQAKEQDFNITVEMPSNLACTGASTGNVCTVRCRNNALAGPFGGCFAVQQTDVTPSTNSADQITTSQSLDAINKQIAQNQLDLPAAIAANQIAGGTEAEQGVAAISGECYHLCLYQPSHLSWFRTVCANMISPVIIALLGLTVTSKAAPVQTIAANSGGAAAAAVAATTPAAGNSAATAAASPNKGSTHTAPNGKGKSNNQARSMKWAKRIVFGDLESVDLGN